MTAMLACMVCAGPFESLLTSGLHAGVAVMAIVAVAVIAALTRGAWSVIRADAREQLDEPPPPYGGPR